MGRPSLGHLGRLAGLAGLALMGGSCLALLAGCGQKGPLTLPSARVPAAHSAATASPPGSSPRAADSAAPSRPASAPSR
ncbi:MAG: hypothetical protein RI988_1844 [Pseudomonadota bacterium]|jgi:predicted small lipoprotein YifL